MAVGQRGRWRPYRPASDHQQLHWSGPGRLLMIGRANGVSSPRMYQPEPAKVSTIRQTIVEKTQPDVLRADIQESDTVDRAMAILVY